MKTNRLFVLLSFLLLSIVAYSQNEIGGTVLSQDGKTPIEFANVAINTKDSVFVAGTTSNEQGKFKIKNIPNGNYYIRVTYLGYQPVTIALNGISKNTDLGDIVAKEESTTLGEVTVTASNVTNKVDRLVVFVTDQQKTHSSDGVNLLTTMDLPRLIVNPTLNSVSLPGDDKVQLCIDGVKVDISRIKAIKPNEVLRIEYIDNPGVRYENVALVINYVLKRATSGGVVGINSSNAITTLFSSEQLTFKMNHKKSEFSFIYGGNFKQLKKAWNDKTSRFNFEDGESMILFDEGIPGKVKENSHLFALNYSVLDNKNYFNATLKYNILDEKKITYTNQSTSLAPERTTLVHQGSNNLQKLPSLDLYYLHSLKNDQTLIFNAVGTYINSNLDQIYEETKDKELITDIVSDVDGKKYSIIGEGIYEKIFANKNRFTAGLKHTQAYANNKYKGTINSLAKMNQSESYLYAEYSGKVDKLSYAAGMGVSRSWIKQEGEKSHTDYIFRPKMTLQYNFKPELFVRLKAEVYNTVPSLANLSNVVQYVDTLRLNAGNPKLKANANYRTGITASWDKKMFSVYYDMSYSYSPNAIMAEIYRENDKFISTFDNQRSWQKLNSELTLKVKPIKDMLTVSLTGGLNRYWSNGNNYTHNNSNFYYRASVMFMYQKFMANFMAMSAYDNLWGETLSDGETIQYFSVNYNFDKFTVGASIMSPFSKYKRESENMNKYSSYKSEGGVDDITRMVSVNFSWNFSFGRKAKSGNKRINNADRDTGIIKAE